MINIDSGIRAAVLQGDGERIRSLLLSVEQVSLINSIRSRKCGPLITTAELASDKNISVQNAGAKLKRLYLSGYLQRHCVIQESGGTEYVYQAAL